MTTRHLRAALLPAVVPLAAATAAALRVGHRRLYADRHRVELKPQPRHFSPDCRGAGGWWVGGTNPEMEACGCWANRPELCVRPLPFPAWPDQPPF
ncbi:hypothetical protein [Streptomyces griseofuscus]|uniref:hypothetical protein n=1 Tax=Streptomyces griseofuscus TaxID=146922 RepID=UPI0033C1251F